MTTENERLDGAAGTDDPALSRLYREASVESAPRDLDMRVLGAARRAARPKYLLPASWFRPLAWTATVGLCLAVAINLNNTPEEVTVVPVKLESNVKASDETMAYEERLEVQPSVAAEQKRLRQAPEIAPVALDEDVARPDASPSAAAEPEQLRERPSDSADVTLNAPRNDPRATRAAGYMMTEADAVSREAGDSSTLCSAENLAAPDAWLRCIEALEAEGRTEAAARERKLFEQRFPSFVVK